MKLKYLIILSALLVGCEKSYVVLKSTMAEPNYYICREVQFPIKMNDLMICKENKECNDFCEKKRSEK